MASPEQPSTRPGSAAPAAPADPRQSGRSRSGSRRSRRTARRRQVTLAIAGSFLLAGLIGVIGWTWSNTTTIDEVTFCPEPNPTAIHAVLVDRGDPISPDQRLRVRAMLERAVAEAPVGSRLSLYVAEADDAEVLNPRMLLCNPGTQPSRLYPSPASMRERYDRAFLTEIDRVMQELEHRADRSLVPTMEAIRAICIDAFRNTPSGGALRMTVVGDMTQYSRLANHHSDRNYDALLAGSRLEPVLADCKSAEVDILYLERPTPAFMPGPQGQAHRRFWELFLQKMKARPRNIEVVEVGAR
jgi:hypothetical protein